MASALALNAATDIINGKGLAPNPQVLTAIASFQALPNIKAVKNLFDTAAAINYNNTTTIQSVFGELEKLGSGVANGQFLIDFYPNSDITTKPSCSGAVTYYGYMPNPILSTTTTSINDASTNVITGWANVAIPSTASFSSTIATQAQIPFANGMSTFANIVMTAAASAAQNFDTNASITVLQNKTYATSGIGYTGPIDLATGGLGSNGILLASIVKNWGTVGTLYDITNMNLISDPYVFGQNLLNQGFGNVQAGSMTLAERLTAIGLNIADITQIPSSSTVTNVQASTVQVAYPTIGQVDLPAQKSVDATPLFEANNPNALLAIYADVKANDLNYITTAVGANPIVTVNTLDQFLDLTKIVDTITLGKLNAFGIKDLNDLGNYLHSIIGQGTFQKWTDVVTLLSLVQVPQLVSQTNTPNTPLLLPSASSTLVNTHFEGTGPFNNPILVDYIGSMAGMPTYITDLTTLVTNSNLINEPITAAINAVTTAVSNYVSMSAAYQASGTTDEFLIYTNPLTSPDVGSITAAVNNVNNLLNNINTTTPAYIAAYASYMSIIGTLYKENLNLRLAGCSFGPGNANTLRNFALTIITKATDATQFYSQSVFANIIVPDHNGDNIRSAIAEYNNTQIYAAAGVSFNNDPQPMTLAYTAQQNGTTATKWTNSTQGTTFLTPLSTSTTTNTNGTTTNTNGTTTSTTIYPTTYSVVVSSQSGLVSNTTGFDYIFYLGPQTLINGAQSGTPAPVGFYAGKFTVTFTPANASFGLPTVLLNAVTKGVQASSTIFRLHVDVSSISVPGSISLSTGSTTNLIDTGGGNGGHQLAPEGPLPLYQIVQTQINYMLYDYDRNGFITQSDVDAAIVAGVSADVITALKSAVQQNIQVVYDLNGDGTITAADALLCIEQGGPFATEQAEIIAELAAQLAVNNGHAPYTGPQIVDAVTSILQNQDLTNSQQVATVAAAMDKYSVTPTQVASAFKVSVKQVQDAYNIAEPHGKYSTVTTAYTQTSNYWNKTVRTATPNANWLNWGLLRSFKGIPVAGWGSDGTVNTSGTVNPFYSGHNVDIVIADYGLVHPGHPEFAVNADGTGGSRVIQYNWLQHSSYLNFGSNGNYSYAWDSTNDKNNNHATHTAGTAAGNTYGWARNANIYTIDLNRLPGHVNQFGGEEQVFEYVRAFHINKPINPATGMRNPTVMNNSWSLNWTTQAANISQVMYQGTLYKASDFTGGTFTLDQLQAAGILAPYRASGDNTIITNLRVPGDEAVVTPCIAAGVYVVGVAGNFSGYADTPTGANYNNYFVDTYYGGTVYYHRGTAPGAIAGTFNVGAMDSTVVEQKADYSGNGPGVNIFAPGSDIMSSIASATGLYSGRLKAYMPTIPDPRNPNFYIGKDSGTSMAGPQVSGFLACLLEKYPTAGAHNTDITAIAIANQLTSTTAGFGVNNDLNGAPNLVLSATTPTTQWL